MTDRWTDASLSALRVRTDPEAEHAVRALLGAGDPHAARALLASLTRNDEPVPADLPAGLRRWLEDGAINPAWADPSRVRAGERVFQRYGLPMIQHLGYCALPSLYALPDVAGVLVRSKRIQQLTGQRVLETTRWVLEIMAPGGLSPRGLGVRSTQKVRLLHAAIRVHLAQEGLANPAVAPINQEQLLATLATFSVLSLRSLRRLGAELTDDEAGALLHCWAVVGHHLGIEAPLLFRSEADGVALWAAQWRLHARASADGRALTAELLAFLDGLLPGALVDGVGPTLMRHLMGDDAAELLGVPAADRTRALLQGYRAVVDAADRLQDRDADARRAFLRLGRLLLTRIEGHARANGRADLVIPLTLREHWGL